MGTSFDPNEPSSAESGIFGLPVSPEKARVLVIPASWEVTVSYGTGTRGGPKAVLDASKQLDLYHESYGAESWKIGVTMLPIPTVFEKRGIALQKKATAHVRALTHNKKINERALREINHGCEDFNAHIERTASTLLEGGKLVGLLGGDHSTPLGLMRAHAKKHSSFGILHIDAHCDLRESYEGFTYSHASIMWNALQLPQLEKLVQVGVRDFSGDEMTLVEKSEGRIVQFLDADMKARQYHGVAWHTEVERIVAELPQNVYISFDIDGLNPSLCPSTGTPVPGGLEYQEAIHLIKTVATSGRRIIGFDLVEVSPGKNEWDANVGMRVLWNLALWSAASTEMRA